MNDTQLYAEIINIGDELLDGHTVNSNAAWMSAALRGIGIPVLRHTVVADEGAAIVRALDGVMAETTHVFVTGGLGPTEDDRTKAVITDYFGGHLVFHQDIYDMIEARFRARGRILSPLNRGQAMLPDNAELIPNGRGTASGMIFRKGGRTFYLMPGVPYEMQDIMERSLLPKLAGQSGLRLIERSVHTFGIPESEIAEMIENHFPELRRDVSLGFYPSVKGITLRLKGKDGGELDKYVSGICEILGDTVVSLNPESMAEVVLTLCRERGLSLALAESCTGGLISSMITDIPGSSRVFREGYVAYSNEAKVNVLGVDPEILRGYGAVSEETVRAMALGARERSGADIAAAVSGIAGPDGGSPEKPVGTVWIAVSYGDRTLTHKISYDRGRRKNKEYAAHAALNLIRLALLADVRS
ncbi:MAG: CinA family nicotinamide mononucleotide deamidase-related protein [Candidatus Marinimicrobia bacterium]|nr:CinA family nicotinamide mononucleotide deamidase-related protein [Candidatus Neomarinimicrobiota bacterium]